MKLRIGLDFDNTIANYDEAFPNVARILGYNNSAVTKRELKQELLKLPDGETVWQKVQGLAYGRYIELASLYPGVREFVMRALAGGNEVFVVSHKTEHGHYDKQRTSLREAATSWLCRQNLVGDGETSIPASNVTFAGTREEKIQKITDLDLDVFIDDLTEVLCDRDFPKQTRKILFGRNLDREVGAVSMQSWREIGDNLFGDLDSGVVLFCIKNIWPELNASSVERIEGRGNSKIFRVSSGAGDIALKVYPDLLTDDRPRRQNEWAALSFLSQNGLQVPMPLRTDQALNWSLIEWIDGSPANEQNPAHLYIAVDFIRGLTQSSRALAPGSKFDLATEACLNPSLVEVQVQARLDALKLVDDLEMRQFVDRDLVPIFAQASKRAREMLGKNYNSVLDIKYWSLSPSDFGLHNAIVTPSRDITFLDFEYFGWDDPVKLTADVCLHPGMTLDESEQRLWISEMKKVFGDDSNFVERLTALYPLYAIRWALIMLNEFRSDKIKNRLHAQSRMQFDVRRTQVRQLEKAKLMLKNAERTIF